MSARSFLAVLALATVVACGSSGGGAPTPAPTAPGFYITVSSMSFAPLDLHVPPGAAVTVLNRDCVAHSVTSEATPGAFTHGAVASVSFDTGQFLGTRTFTIPAGAPAGTVIPYFCTAHLGTMATPNGTLTVDPAAVATTVSGSLPSCGGGGGY